MSENSTGLAGQACTHGTGARVTDSLTPPGYPIGSKVGNLNSELKQGKILSVGSDAVSKWICFYLLRHPPDPRPRGADLALFTVARNSFNDSPRAYWSRNYCTLRCVVPQFMSLPGRIAPFSHSGLQLVNGVLHQVCLIIIYSILT